MKAGQTMTHATLGRVYVLAVDSDPTCLVWVVSVESCEVDAFVSRESLS